MDKLDRIIAECRREVARVRAELTDAQARLAVSEAKLTAFEEASRLRPATEEPKVRRGRQPGAISQEWRNVLFQVFIRGAVDYATIHEIARSSGIETDLGNVRDRVRAFLRSGLMEGSIEDGFEVTNEAAERFQFASVDLNEEPPEVEDDDEWIDDEGDDDDYDRAFARTMG
jgi:hypothetical protein